MSASHRRPSDELELKYAAADLAALEAFLDERFPAPAPDRGWREVKVTDRYFDTADGALAQAGLGARLRETGGRTIVGLKSEVGVASGLHHRREIEGEATARLAPAEWPASESRRLILDAAGERSLRERFTLRQLRRERDWQGRGGACRFSLDLVRVRHGRRQLGELRELEVELRKGDRRLLRAIDRTVAASGLATHEPRSKMALAAEMVELAAPLDARQPFAEAGRRVLRRHLERMLDRERLVRAGDRLALKQMRVATRRMRATWRLFEGAYDRREQRRYVGELRRVARRLGAVRDMDVLLESTPDERQLAPLADAWRERRAAAWRRLLAMLDSAAYAAFVEHYGAFTRSPGLAPGGLAERRLLDVAGSRVWAAYERVRAHDAHIGTGDVAALHALRIDAKRLRYAIETFADLLPREAASDLIARLTRVQDHLGALNDAAVAAAEAAAWSETSADAADTARRAARRYAARRRSEVGRLARSFAGPWRGVAGPTFRRELARAIGELG